MIELLIKDARGNVIRHQLGEGKHQLGKSIQSDVVTMDPHASRHHADLIVTPNGVFLIDADSTNGTWVNKKKTRKALLQIGDSFQIAKLELTIAKASHYFALKKGRPYKARDINLKKNNKPRKFGFFSLFARLFSARKRLVRSTILY